MAVIDVQTKVSKESYELGQGVAGFVGAVKTALADGWQVGQDLPAVVAAAMGHLVPAIDGIQDLPGEAAEDAASFARAWALAGAAVYEKLKG